jgi:hypothetical protein
MNSGYVTYVDDNPRYRELVDILIESVLSFSNRSIEVFSINCDYYHSSGRVLNQRVDIKEKNMSTICYTKLYSSINCSFDHGIQLDSDIIITDKMDTLFEKAREVGQTPLCPIHPSDPNDQDWLMSYLGVKIKTQPYIHAASYIFSNSCKPFLQECYDVSQKLVSIGYTPPWYDETILNTMLWKYKSEKYVDNYVPYFGCFLDPSTKNTHGYGWMENVNFYTCHGIKDPSLAKSVLIDLQRKNS